MKERLVHTVRRQKACIQCLQEENFLLRLAATEWALRYHELLNSIGSVNGGKDSEPSDTSV